MTSTFTRIGTANTYDSSIRNISGRQSALSGLQENLTSGKRVLRASDDPTSAANAERALNRISRIATDQRALESQRNAITQAESALGEATDVLQRFRELVVSAGNGVHSSAERKSIAVELQGLRDQIFSLSNTKDTNGQPLFGALGSALAPFVGPQAVTPDYKFNGLPGQTTSNDVSIPFALDGDAAFMNQTARDGVFSVGISTVPSSRTLTTDNVVVVDTTAVSQIAYDAAAAVPPANVPYPKYTLTFTAVDSTTVPGTTSGTIQVIETPPVSGSTNDIAFSYPTGKSLNVTAVLGLAFNITGTPAVGDTVTIESRPSIFSVLDDAIQSIKEAPNSNSATQAVGQALHNIDIGMGRISAVRGQAGDLLNRADRITSNQERRSIQLESDRSRAEDLDMVKGISDFNNQQTGYQAALQTYAQVQKLSLFNFIS